MNSSDSLKLIVVGGGPAGISCAVESVGFGLKADELVILEKGSQSIQAIRQFYPDKKMTLANYKNLSPETEGSLPSFPEMTKQETIDYFDSIISKHTLDYRLNSEVTKIEKQDDSFLVSVNQQKLKAEAVAVAIGILGRPSKPGIKIPALVKRKVFFDLTTQPIENCRVLVVGGGDTSAEYCEILVEQNCETTFIYRRPQITKMMKENLEKIESLQAADRLKMKLDCELESLEDAKENGIQVNYIGGETDFFDHIVYAIGGTTPVNFLRTCGIEFTAAGWPDVNDNGETNISGLFLLGDLVAGKTGGSIVTSYNTSYRAAQKISEYLQQKK